MTLQTLLKSVEQYFSEAHVKKMDNFINTFVYAGLTPSEMKMCAAELKKRNVRVMGILLPVVLLAMFALSLVSFIPGSGEEPNRNLYLTYTTFFLIDYFLYHYYFKSHPRAILLLSYLFILTAYSFGSYECVFLGRDSSSTLYCVMMIAVPILVIDVPIRHSILAFFTEIILIASLFVFGDPGNAGGDRFVLINSVFSLFLGVCCSYINQRTKFSDIRNHLMLEMQRDTDMMTGARSRVAYARDLSVMSDGGLSAGVIFADVNGLKKANDTYGHEAGDRLIKSAFSLMLGYFNHTTDSIYRIGGDEFVIISLGERKADFENRFRDMTENGENHEIISCGCTWLEKVKDAESAVKEAERLMYDRKNEYYRSHPEKERRTR